MTKPETGQRLLVSLIRCADQAVAEIAEALRPFGLTPAQFEILRALEPESQGLACSEIGGRLLARDPDITRLLDRLERRQVVLRSRSDQDRRVVMVQLTPAGHALFEQVRPALRDAQRRQFAHLGEARAEQLLELLHAAQERG